MTIIWRCCHNNRNTTIMVVNMVITQPHAASFDNKFNRSKLEKVSKYRIQMDSKSKKSQVHSVVHRKYSVAGMSHQVQTVSLIPITRYFRWTTVLTSKLKYLDYNFNSIPVIACSCHYTSLHHIPSAQLGALTALRRFQIFRGLYLLPRFWMAQK